MSPIELGRAQVRKTVVVSQNAHNETAELLLQLLKAGPEKLASEGSSDAHLLSQLESFSLQLHSSIESVKKVRDEEEQASREARQAELEEKRSRMLASNLCFECKTSSDTALKPCTCFKENGVSGNGVLLCDRCLDKGDGVIGTCPECQAFLFQSCCGPSYTCKGCNERFCLSCANHSGSTKPCDECVNWYCAECVTENVEEEACCSCRRSHSFCQECAASAQLKKCEGACEQPLCNDCVQKRPCGNNARHCGSCVLECHDCDHCHGYHD